MKKNLQQTKEQFVHELFSKIAPRYDLMNRVLSFNQDGYWRRFAVGKTGLAAGGKVLDVACGSGQLTGELAKQVGLTGQVVGLDFCQNMLTIAKQHLNVVAEGQDVQLLEGDATALPFPDNSFDCVTAGFALRNIPDIQAVIAEMRRVVKPGGRVISLDLAKPGSVGFKQLYYLYFEHILPRVGKLGVGIDGPYHWLPQSLREFPHQDQLKELFSVAGLQEVTYYELTGGIAAVHVGIK
jgi:demethylmenaquinone methyltransferase/2-methoxy-6-polyprenyl-1,4-benzoquinol methylase